MAKEYFKPKWGTVHDKAVAEFETKTKVIKTRTVDDIVSIFFK